MATISYINKKIKVEVKKHRRISSIILCAYLSYLSILLKNISTIKSNKRYKLFFNIRITYHLAHVIDTLYKSLNKKLNKIILRKS